MSYLKVISSCLIHGANGPLIQCEMSDGSTWTCDMGGNWTQVKPSDEELTKKFREHVGV